MANLARHPTVSPVLVIQPQPYYQTQLAAGTFGRHYPLHMQPQMTSNSGGFTSYARSRGRKRCRDEALTDLDPEQQSLPCVDSHKGRICSSTSRSSQCSSTKTHINQEPTMQEDPAGQDQSCSRKVQKLACNTTEPSNVSMNCGSTSHNAVNNLSSISRNGASNVDPYAVCLGVGWGRISEDEHIQAAARGWARFIEINYGFSRVRICLESKGLQSYLVEASNGYFLFSENLRKGRLVSRTVEGALHNLTLSPPGFEGPEIRPAGEKEQHGFPVDSAMAIDQ
ncbi:hypothetical protein AAL_01140 [Moelleriella libera RCEF 2490]|uniref:Uncharacterized protein n=1 Tax=Moelleriella libera RCEF 2490 TaxID=1081109 RepID=A0A166RSK5_9HYPO|nr:hypothetical protein AAL_01140 [Moelleriella libera RCEF 2490]